MKFAAQIGWKSCRGKKSVGILAGVAGHLMAGCGERKGYVDRERG